MTTINTTHFFKTDYVDFSVYDNVRKIASYIDGQKNSTRKVLHTLLETNCNSFTKVSNLGPRVQDFAQYLHGSLEGGIVNMTQDYVGSGNNIPLLLGDGNFGSRFIPQAAASRYIFAKVNPIVENLFQKDDNVNLASQEFEGDKIEPRFFVPIIPMVLVNSSEGLSIGFAQKIMPRNPKEIIKWVKQKAEGKRITADLTPHWVGQDFIVTSGESAAQWEIKGGFKRVSSTKLVIDSLPAGYNLKGYQKVLDDLVDKKIIKDYEDLSDDDVFNFEVFVTREFSSKSDEKLMDIFKLVKRVSENFTCIDENNKIVQFESVEELLESWWKVRLQYNQLKKDHLIQRTTADIKEAEIVKWLISGVVDGSIVIQNKSVEQIQKSVDQYHEEIPRLLRLPMARLTSTEINKLNERIKSLKAELKVVKSWTLEDITLNDLTSIS